LTVSMALSVASLVAVTLAVATLAVACFAAIRTIHISS
jgi:hypothetical protein